MSARQRSISLGFTTERYAAGTHMCYLWDDEGERADIIASFVESGLAAGEMVGYFTDSLSPAEIEAKVGGPSPSLRVTPAVDTYCPGGVFSPDRMLDHLRGLHTTSVGAGLPGARVSGEMSWALRGIPGSDRLIEYECRINTIVDTHPTTAVCQYDVRRFDGATLFDVLSVHPMMIVKGQVVRNPYYFTPEVFLARPRRRG